MTETIDPKYATPAERRQYEAGLLDMSVRIPEGYTHGGIVFSKYGPRLLITAEAMPAMFFDGHQWVRVLPADG